MNKVKFGILGVSNHFIKRIILPLQNSNICCAYSLASRDINKAKKTASDFNIPVVSENYEELINTPEIDAIYLPLPNHMHYTWIMKCIEAKKPVICEKPLSLDANQSKKIIKTSKKHEIPVMEAFMYKFHPLWQHVLNLIKTNHIGKISYIHTAFSYNNIAPDNIRNINEYGGGGLMDIGCYAISVARFLIQKEPDRVVSMMKIDDKFKTDIHTSALMDFGSARASFQISTQAEPFQRVDIIGTAGSISIPLPFNPYIDTPSSITVNSIQGSRQITFPIANAYGLMFEAFSKSLKNNLPLPINLDDALNNMLVIDAIRQSDKTKKWIDLKSQH